MLTSVIRGRSDAFIKSDPVTAMLEIKMPVKIMAAGKTTVLRSSTKTTHFIEKQNCGCGEDMCSADKENGDPLANTVPHSPFTSNSSMRL